MQMLTNVRLVLVNVIKIVTITLDHTHALVMLVLHSKVMDCIVMVIQLHGSMLLYSIVIGPWMNLDNDECDGNKTNICEDLCINTNGSFYCGCSTPGYTLQSNGITCQSESCASTYYELHNFVTYIIVVQFMVIILVMYAVQSVCMHVSSLYCAMVWEQVSISYYHLYVSG